VAAELVGNLNIALVVFARIFAVLSVAPLLSSGSIPGVARAGLALFLTVRTISHPRWRA